MDFIIKRRIPDDDEVIRFAINQGASFSDDVPATAELAMAYLTDRFAVPFDRAFEEFVKIEETAKILAPVEQKIADNTASRLEASKAE